MVFKIRTSSERAGKTISLQILLFLNKFIRVHKTSQESRHNKYPWGTQTSSGETWGTEQWPMQAYTKTVDLWLGMTHPYAALSIHCIFYTTPMGNSIHKCILYFPYSESCKNVLKKDCPPHLQDPVG